MPKTVLVFDSGVGALSLLPALRASLPGARILYASDNAAYPYGTRSADGVTRRVAEVLARLNERFAPDLAVIGCNTASTVALPRLRGDLAIPVIGVVPAIKPAAARSRTHCIALLATPATVARPYTTQLIEEFASHCEVLRLGSSELVDIAERKLRGSPVALASIEAILAPLKAEPQAARIDTIVLGCTHFPLLRDELARAWQAPVDWIDSSAAIARRAGEVLAMVTGSIATPTARDRALPDLAIFTRESADLEGLGPALADYGFAGMEIIGMPATAPENALTRL